MHNVPKRENKIMSIAGAAHNVNIFGSGETTVVLGHGFGSDQSVWKHLVPHLVDHYRVVLYDNIGAGTTNPNHYNFDRYSTIEGYALDLISILEEFNVEKCICVGHSLSAMVATTASIFRPDLFHKLIIMCANPRMTNTDDYCGGFEQADIDQLNAAMEWNYEASVASIPPMVIGGDINSVAMREYNRTLFNMRPDIALHVFHTLTSLDLRPYLPSVTVPCHIIQTSKDLFVPVAVGEYLHHYLGGKSIMEVINTEGHLPHLSAPDVTIPVLLRHIMYDIS